MYQSVYVFMYTCIYIYIIIHTCVCIYIEKELVRRYIGLRSTHWALLQHSPIYLQTSFLFLKWCSAWMVQRLNGPALLSPSLSLSLSFSRSQPFEPFYNIHLYMYIYTLQYLHICVYIYIHLCINLYVYICIYTCIFICIFAYTYVCTYIYRDTYVVYIYIERALLQIFRAHIDPFSPFIKIFKT